MSKSKTTVRDVTEWFLGVADKLYRQGLINGPRIFRCSICLEPLLPGEKIEWDHIHGEAMGGAHDVANLRPVHYDPCHKKKSARDVAALAKINRLTGKTKGRPKVRMRSRPFPSGHRKIPSRPFPRRAS